MSGPLDNFTVPPGLPEPTRKLLQCFVPIPPPAPKPGQTFQPRNASWPETTFLYRVDIKRDTSHVTNDMVMFGSDSEPFFDIKETMKKDRRRWGRYRIDWLGNINNDGYSWYFMDGKRAMEFRLWVDL